jgi:hypothetical protein
MVRLRISTPVKSLDYTIVIIIMSLAFVSLCAVVCSHLTTGVNTEQCFHLISEVHVIYRNAEV